MELLDIKNAIRDLSVSDRRNVALYILELEKRHVQEAIGPQIAEDLEAVSKVLQGAVEKIKKSVKNSL